MNISKTIGKNIEALMQKNGLSNRQLAEILEVTHPTVSKYLKGEQVIDSEKLSQLARYFNKPFDYFFDINNDDLSLLFRADKPEQALTEADTDQIKMKFKHYIDIVGRSKYNFIPQQYHLDIVTKRLSEEDEAFLEKVAYEQRKFFNIEGAIPENYFNVVEDKGINIIASKFDNESFFGASSYSDLFGSFIFVNTKNAIPEERQIFTLFHEYGHLLFHQSDYKKSDYNPYYGSNADLKEKVVNSFAGYFLLPRPLVKEYIDTHNKDVNVFDMKHHFKVSIQTLYIALKNYGFITPKQYKDFWVKAGANQWLKSEPNPLDITDDIEKNARLVSTIKKLFINEEISTNRISEVLNLDMMETRKCIKKWSEADEQYEKFA